MDKKDKKETNRSRLLLLLNYLYENTDEGHDASVAEITSINIFI